MCFPPCTALLERPLRGSRAPHLTCTAARTTQGEGMPRYVAFDVFRGPDLFRDARTLANPSPQGSVVYPNIRHDFVNRHGCRRCRRQRAWAAGATRHGGPCTHGAASPTRLGAAAPGALDGRVKARAAP